MLWIDYTVNQFGSDFKIEGDTPSEVMDKEQPLYRSGDVFIVDDNGWLVKQHKFDIETTQKEWLKGYRKWVKSKTQVTE